ncbi:MAG: J domain-containing protein [Desulfobacterales bacterium]|nr:J domain-containing protein [Desulfobacterales bacterium]
MKNPYEILGVTKNTTDDEIKNAYRILAKKYHPDLNPTKKGAEQKFKEISVAYKLIKNKEAREKFEKGSYDEKFTEASFRSEPFNSEFQESRRRYTYHFDENSDADDDLFKSFFSGTRGNGGGIDIRGQDHLYSMEIDLRDAIRGTEREIMLTEGKKLKVKIPAGINNKEKLRFKHQGGLGIGKGKPGDAFVEIVITPSSTFKINGSNLEIEVPLSLDEAINGSKIKVPTIDGIVMLTVPPGVNTGTKIRIKEKGMPIGKGNDYGDQIVIVRVVLPKNMDAEFREFIKNWSKNHPYNPREI